MWLPYYDDWHSEQLFTPFNTSEKQNERNVIPLEKDILNGTTKIHTCVTMAKVPSVINSQHFSWNRLRNSKAYAFRFLKIYQSAKLKQFSKHAVGLERFDTTWLFTAEDIELVEGKLLQFAQREIPLSELERKTLDLVTNSVIYLLPKGGWAFLSCCLQRKNQFSHRNMQGLQCSLFWISTPRMLHAGVSVTFPELRRNFWLQQGWMNV